MRRGSRGPGRSVDRGYAGRAIEPRKDLVRGADDLVSYGRRNAASRYRKWCCDPAWSKTPRTHTSLARRNREIPSPALGNGARVRAVNRLSTTAMHVGGKSDRPIVPEKSANNARDASGAAERMEERGLTKGNLFEQTRYRTPGRKRSDHGEL